MDWARAVLRNHDEQALADYLRTAPHAQRAHPTSEHFLPLPFAFGAAPDHTRVQVLDGGILYGVLSIKSYLFSSPTANLP